MGTRGTIEMARASLLLLLLLLAAGLQVYKKDGRHNNNNLIRGTKTSGESNTIRLHHFPSASPKSLLIVYTYPRENIKRNKLRATLNSQLFVTTEKRQKCCCYSCSFLLLCYDVVKYIYLLSYMKRRR